MGSCAQGAILIQAGRITLAGPVSGKHADPEPVIQKRRKLGRIAWGVAIAVLLFALAWFNWIEPAQEAAKTPKPDQTAAAHSQTETQSSEKADTKPAAAAHPETEAQSSEKADTKPAAAAHSETETQSSEKADVKPAVAATGTIGSEVGDLLPDFRTELLGGGQYFLIGNLIENQFITVGEWNFGSAISMIMAVVMMLMMMAVRKVEIHNQGGKEE